MIKRRTRLAALIFSLLLVLSGCAAAEQAAEPTATPWPTNEAGMPYLLYDYPQSPMTFTDLQGKAIYLNFFTTWCYYCKVEMPELYKIHQTYGDQVQVILIHVPSDDTEEAAVQYLKENGYDSMRMVEDKDFFLTSFYQLEGFPLSVVIDKDGFLAMYQAGAMTYEQMEQALAAAGVETAAE